LFLFTIIQNKNKHFMKTNLLFAAALLLSAGMSAQTIKSSDAQSSGTSAKAGKITELQSTSSSNTAVSSNAGKLTTQKANQEKQQAKQEVAAIGTAANTRAKQAKTEAVSAVKEKSNSSASINGEAQVNAGAKDNKVAQDASLQGNASASGQPAKTTVKAIAKRTGTEVKAGSKAAVNTVSVAKTSVKTTVAKTVQPKPAAIKMQTRVQANGAIKIK
jgi:hypothetical protein